MRDIQNQLLSIFTLCLVGLLSAVAHAGHAAYVLTHDTEQLMREHVHQGVYTDRVHTSAGLAQFSIMMPQSKSVSEYAHVQLGRFDWKDTLTPGVRIIFRTKKPGRPMYSVWVRTQDLKHFDAARSLDFYRKNFPDKALQEVKRLGSHIGSEGLIKKVYERKHLKINGKPAEYVVYTQQIRPGQTFTHFFSCVVYGAYTVVFWGIVDSDGLDWKHNPMPSLAEVKHLKWKQMNDFMRSFKLIEPTR